jgi:hypothetical protein
MHQISSAVDHSRTLNAATGLFLKNRVAIGPFPVGGTDASNAQPAMLLYGSL